MIKSFLAISLISFISCLPVRAYSQFMNLQIEVEPELSVTVLQPLDFGTVVINSGITEIAPGNPSMGVFSIDAINTQQLLVSFEKPAALTSGNSGQTSSIPIEINASYISYNDDSVQLSTPIRRNPESITISTVPGQASEIWARAFIYVYGSVDVQNIPEGQYTGELIINVTYE